MKLNELIHLSRERHGRDNPYRLATGETIQLTGVGKEPQITTQQFRMDQPTGLTKFRQRLLGIASLPSSRGNYAIEPITHFLFVSPDILERLQEQTTQYQIDLDAFEATSSQSRVSRAMQELSRPARPALMGTYPENPPEIVILPDTSNVGLELTLNANSGKLNPKNPQTVFDINGIGVGDQVTLQRPGADTSIPMSQEKYIGELVELERSQACTITLPDNGSLTLTGISNKSFSVLRT